MVDFPALARAIKIIVVLVTVCKLCVDRYVSLYHTRRSLLSTNVLTNGRPGVPMMSQMSAWRSNDVSVGYAGCKFDEI